MSFCFGSSRREPTIWASATSALALSAPGGIARAILRKNVLITGATRVIGAACTKALAEAGAALCVVLREPAAGANPNLETVNALPCLCDLGNLTAIMGIFQLALTVMGGTIDVLVNCAGIHMQRCSPSISFSEQDWDDVLDVNLKSVWLLSQAAGQHMVPRRSGKIINFCSLLTFQGGGLGQVTKALSNDWSQHNVQVNGIRSGYVATDMNEKFLADAVRYAADLWTDSNGALEEFARPVVFLREPVYLWELLVGWMGR
ncbi:NAD(P)-binding protein [Peniophora sp. CONT]|nr:NAD(P)-binding protein [Peniophora sp. CONT]